ncbi:MAG: hypothetical protein V3U73_11295 [bacterium]
MKVKVTKKGVVIPRKFLEGVEEVEIRKENDLVLVVPKSGGDPILEFGKKPVACGVPDASEQHDKYLYGTQP